MGPQTLQPSLEGVLVQAVTRGEPLPGTSADGTPVVAPTQDMVLGCYYLTMEREATHGKAPVRVFAGEEPTAPIGIEGIVAAKPVSPSLEAMRGWLAVKAMDLEVAVHRAFEIPDLPVGSASGAVSHRAASVW